MYSSVKCILHYCANWGRINYWESQLVGGWPVGYLHNTVVELNSGLPRTNLDNVAWTKDLQIWNPAPWITRPRQLSMLEKFEPNVDLSCMEIIYKYYKSKSVGRQKLSVLFWKTWNVFISTL